MKIVRLVLDRYLAVVVLSLGLLFFGYSWFMAQQNLARVQVNTYEGLMRLDYQESAIRFQRDSRSERPSITTPDGFPLIEYSDQLSAITVNGSRSSLWEADHGYVVDADKHVLYHSYTTDAWTLTTEIALGPTTRQTTLRYYYSNNAISQVTLELAHVHWYYTAPVLSAEGFTAQIAAAPRADFERGLPAPSPRYSVSVREGPQAQTVGWSAFAAASVPANTYGLYDISTTFTSLPVPANERTLIAAEIVTWDDAQTSQK